MTEFLNSLSNFFLKQATTSDVIPAAGHANADLTKEIVRKNLENARKNRPSLGNGQIKAGRKKLGLLWPLLLLKN